MRHSIPAGWIFLLLTIGLAGCAVSQRPGNEVRGEINDLLLKSATERKAPPAGPADKSLMPPLAPKLAAEVATAEPRFDLSVVNAPATQVFMALVSGTRYSMLLPPDVSGSITVNLKDVTLMESLDTIRELYGYEYRVQGKRIFIEPNTIKSRVFQINYLSSRRHGSSDLRVSNSTVTNTYSGGGTTATASIAQAVPAGTGTPTAARANDASRVSMTSDSDFWGDLSRTLGSIVGSADGRSVVVNPSSGVVLVRALPNELRNVEKYLKATQLVAERQVMLEAKIIDVALNDAYQAGINWASFNGTNNRVTAAVTQPYSVTRPIGGPAFGSTSLPISGVPTSTEELISSSSGTVLAGVGGIVANALGSGFIGLALQTSNFAALLNFLETQGSVSVLSSPRIATLNNQKAVLKVGTEEFYVTDIQVTAGTVNAIGASSAPIVTPRFQQLFSGIALDVTPQIDEDGYLILHVHPAITQVKDENKTMFLGGDTGTISVPMAVSRINETDSIVRIQDGNIVAIGGLMRLEQSNGNAGLPGASSNPLLGKQDRSLTKRELVILIKPTLIDGDRAWAQDIKEIQERVQAYPSGQPAQ